VFQALLRFQGVIHFVCCGLEYIFTILKFLQDNQVTELRKPLVDSIWIWMVYQHKSMVSDFFTWLNFNLGILIRYIWIECEGIQCISLISPIYSLHIYEPRPLPKVLEMISSSHSPLVSI
jgi:hypothetical protein